MVKKRKREEVSCEVGEDGEEGEREEEEEDVDEDEEGHHHESKKSLASSTTTTTNDETPVVCNSDDEALELLSKGCYNFVLSPSVDWFKISGNMTDQELDAIFRALEAPNRIEDIDFCKFERLSKVVVFD